MSQYTTDVQPIYITRAWAWGFQDGATNAGRKVDLYFPVSNARHSQYVAGYEEGERIRLYRQGRDLYLAGQPVYDSDHPATIDGWMAAQVEHHEQVGDDDRHVRYEEQPGYAEAPGRW